MSKTYLRGLMRRRAVPLLALAALAGGMLVSSWGSSPVGAAPSSPHAKPISSNVKSVPGDRTARPLSVQQKASRAGSTADGAAATRSTGPGAFLLELDAQATASTWRSTLGRGRAAAKAAVRTQRGKVEALQRNVEVGVRSAVPRARVLYRVHSLLAAVAVQADAKDLPALQGVAGVKAVHPIAAKRRSNAAGVPLVGAPAAWTNGELGQDVTVGVIDSGVDYTHANFGGPGTPEAFLEIDRDSAVPGQFPTAKVIGGFDFAGDAYNADPGSTEPDPPAGFPFNPVPDPDPNPIDCKHNGPDSNVGHGTHVAGTLTGLGVAADNTTYEGPYNGSTPFDTMRIGPGVAPRSALYALRVFGCAGSTNVVGDALRFAMDPNDDGDFSDRLDVVNMSLGSDFGSPDDGDSILSDLLSQQGTVVVASSGNGGDLYDVGGSPGNARRVIGVAGGDDGVAILDALRVNSPASIDGDYGAEVSIAFPYEENEDLTGVLAPIPGEFNPDDLGENNKDGCDPLTPEQAAAVDGKVAWLEWTDIDSDRRCGSAGRSGNVREAGAIGFVLAGDAEVFAAGITGDPEIPGVLIVNTAADLIRDHLDEDVEVTIGQTLRNTVKQDLSEDNADKVYTSSSRGIRGEGNLKPDVTGVAVQVFSTNVGTGFDGQSLSGTSMSSPMVAGIAALVRSKHPDWSPEEVKANIMNTAGKDIFTGDGHTGDKYPPNRVGAGRVDVPAALDNQVLAYVLDDPGAVSVSFGPLAVTAPLTETKTVKVVNKGISAAAYDLAYEPLTQVPGVVYSVRSRVTATNPDETKLALTPRGSALLDVTVTIEDPAALTKTIDPTMATEQAGTVRQFLADASGRVVLSATDSERPELRVPVYSAPRPASAMRGANEIRLEPGDFPTGELPLLGHGVDQGDGSEQVTSIVSGYALQATSGQLPACTEIRTEGCVLFADDKPADVKALGVTTDAPAIRAAGGDAFEEGFAYFAVSSHGPWRTPAGLTDFEVFIDIDRDGEVDKILFTTRLTDSDVFVSALFDVNAGETFPEVWFLNALPANFDTAIYDSDSVVLPVSLAALGVTPETRRIDYGVATFSGYHSEAVDLVGLSNPEDPGNPTLTVDVLRPALTATDGESPDVMYADLEGLPLVIRKDVPAYRADKTKGLLLIHHHNVNGSRAQVVKVKQPTFPRLTLSRSTIQAGQSVTAAVAIPPSSGPHATGTIVIKRTPGVVLATRTTTNGNVSVTLTPGIPGTYTIYAQYLGDDNYLLAYSNSQVLTVRP